MSGLRPFALSAVPKVFALEQAAKINHKKEHKKRPRLRPFAPSPVPKAFGIEPDLTVFFNKINYDIRIFRKI